MNIQSLAGANAALVIMKKELLSNEWKNISMQELVIRYQVSLLCIIGFISTDPNASSLKELVEKEYLALNEKTSRRDILSSVFKIKKQLILDNPGIIIYDEKYEKIN